MISLLLFTALGGCSTELLKCRANSKSDADVEACEKKAKCTAPVATCTELDWQCVANCASGGDCLAACASKPCLTAIVAYRGCMVSDEAASSGRCDEKCVRAFGLPPPRHSMSSRGVGVSGNSPPLPPGLVGTWIEQAGADDQGSLQVVENGAPRDEARRTLDLKKHGFYLENVSLHREVGYNGSVTVSSAGFALVDKDELTLTPTGVDATVFVCSTSYGHVRSPVPVPRKFRFRADATSLTLEDASGRKLVLKKK